MTELLGLTENTRANLALVLRETRSTISVEQVASILNFSREKASRWLSLLVKNGWMSRIKRGLYVPVPLEAQNSQSVIDDPWVLANQLFSPCYIGGWSAAEHFNLTEQIFRSVIVVRTKPVRTQKQELGGVPFVIRVVKQESMFGLVTVWRGSSKVQISDPSRTIVDLVYSPKVGGGITHVTEILKTYLKSEYYQPELLITYLVQFNKGSVIKRLGFLLEKIAPTQSKLISFCKSHITQGLAELDPALPKDHLVTAWKLWVPKGFLEGG